MKLVKLEKVDVRDVWRHEAKDFTTWLAKDENLEILNEALDLDGLEPIEQESRVGKFSADILAKEVGTNRIVVIENQLEESNHDHLGKCITYASGKNASIVIWIVSRANEEHRKAIEWLNDRTDDDLAFFLVEVETLRIGNSDIAPNFKVIECPNEWAKAAKRNREDVSETCQTYRRFWTAFTEYAKTREDFKKVFQTPKPQPQNWLAFRSFAKGCGLSLVCNRYPARVLVRIYISQHSPFFDNFVERYGEIETALGLTLECGRASSKDKTFSVVHEFDLIGDEPKWPDCFKWLCDTLLDVQPEVLKIAKN